MSIELSSDGVEKLLQGVSIPPRPALLLEVDSELRSSDPDLKRLSGLVGKDVALSAAMLKTLNSPFYGLRAKVTSVPQAVQLLGMSNARNVVTGLALRNSMSSAAASLERFWDSAEKVAAINAFVATLIPRAPREDAYALGLFRDCGIPLLMQRFGDYRETLKIASSENRPLCAVEQARHGTSHTAVGYVTARSWQLSDVLCQAVRHHHDLRKVGAGDSLPAAVRQLVAINFLGEHLFETLLQHREDPHWEDHAGMVLDLLDLSNDDYFALESEVLARYA